MNMEEYFEKLHHLAELQRLRAEKHSRENPETKD
ncbi:MAG: hypothetical protein JWM81_650 [Candidatus Saccharibacteria bacterium]|nr:hypothetical protein [Candidatus Saccharibacteria bacterium]